MKRNNFSKTWWSAVGRAGPERGLRLHDLRDANASALIAAGESVKVIQSRMGHASTMVTLEVYGHMFPDSDDQTRAAVDAYHGNPADSLWTVGASAQVRAAGSDYLEKA